MSEQSTRIKDQASGDYVATRNANELDEEGHSRVVQLIDLVSRQLDVPVTTRGATTTTTTSTTTTSTTTTTSSSTITTTSITTTSSSTTSSTTSTFPP